MHTIQLRPPVPKGLEDDLSSSCDFVLRFKDDAGNKKDTRWSSLNGARATIILRPFIVVEELEGDGALKIVTSIPLESVTAIDVDDSEPNMDAEGRLLDWDETPICRWVRHPWGGLLRFTA